MILDLLTFWMNMSQFFKSEVKSVLIMISTATKATHLVAVNGMKILEVLKKILI